MIVVDLFSGCGGFSLGAHQAGFHVAAAFDNDPILTSSFPFNFPRTRLERLDVSTLGGETVRNIVGRAVDGIFGGPPCQGFSDIGQRRQDDPRRELVTHFFRIVREMQPAFFVMENVRGLGYSNTRGLLDKAMRLVASRYAILGPQIWDAADFGGATRRRRLFVIGIHKDAGEGLNVEDVELMKCRPATVKDAIGDLNSAILLGEDKGFDLWRVGGKPSPYAKRLRAPDKLFTGQRATKHSAKIVKRFEEVVPGEVDTVGRHPRLAWTGQCPTLRAGTGADRGSYQSVRPIHPDEPRVITVREAARLQGFPDTHRFHPTVWHSFRMIGNSVSPIMARAIFAAINTKLQAKYRTAAE